MPKRKKKSASRKKTRKKKPMSKKKTKAFTGRMKDSFTKKQYRSVIEEYTGIAKIYDDKWGKYLAGTEEAILAKLKLKGKETILDAGCGTGSLIVGIQKKFKHKGKIHAFDITPAMLELAEFKLSQKKFNKNLQLELAHCENFGAKTGSVDVVICASVFHYLPHPEKALDEFHRVMKKNGRLLLLDFCTDFAVTKVYDSLARMFHRAHHKAYSSTHMSELLKKHKFKVLSLKKWKVTPMLGVMLFEARKR